MSLATFLIATLFVTLANADRKNCQKIEINHQLLYGECCVIVKDSTIQAKEELLRLLIPKTNRLVKGHVHVHTYQGVPVLIDFHEGPHLPSNPNEYHHQHQVSVQDEATTSGSAESLDGPPSEERNVDGSTTVAPRNESSTKNVIGKTVLDNRNAVDVPTVMCPPGQARGPDGNCADEF
ncbi:hypothetical protein ABEB36_010545 [Hypothenemus hampei]|uniref:Uncharacterized protein n=1 Tax=Hypothenemus hampei TaxID=57062 RepID=A0ABD1EM82_HYPHA